MRKGERGFSIWEIFVVMGLIAVFFPIIWHFYEVSETSKRIKVTKERIKAIEEAVKVMYVSNLQYAEANCYGWSDPSCSGMTLTPYPGSDNTRIVMNTRNSLVYSTLQAVGCNVNGTEIRCQDGWGDWMVFELQNYHSPDSSYVDPYLGNFFRMTVRYRHGAVEIGIGEEIEWSLSKTNAKLSELATAIKRFTRNIRLLELTNVCNATGTSSKDPSGGLRSWDDAMVPWVWKVVSSQPQALCSGAETATGCGCSNHSSVNVWETNPSWRIVDTSSEWSRVLSNLGLPAEYRTDGFGNALDLVVLADANGNPLSVPPRPQPNYPWSGVWKTRIGVLEGGVWYSYFDVVSE